ncbi:hypothetical protein ACFOTA_05585 [Chitinophaga sp. GCM10012297]|uniref:Uncharacterized protein n=1 Tax=Chitinophaga chungangae TaxID=2821488 RepID=A0ABS3YAG3_9BACT|nr:hypothetical protein [Chitinophaga chungangae]MBO9151668.1 hypothetical protein [Chitinophaga chungangae]
MENINAEPEKVRKHLHELYGIRGTRVRNKSRDAWKPPPAKSTGSWHFKFLSWEDVFLIQEVTETEERAKAFMEHIRNIYAGELKQKEEERAALRASFGYP